MMSWKAVIQGPSYYEVDVGGRKVSVVLLTKDEAGSLSCWEEIEYSLGKTILGVACAAGCGRAPYPRNLTNDCILDVPIHYEGNEDFRRSGFAKLITLLFQACVQNKVILIHCNQSFHRGPLLFAAVLSKLGMSLAQAFHFISAKRTIYQGHLVNYEYWPESHKYHYSAHKLLSAYEYARSVYTAPQVLEREFCKWMNDGASNAGVVPNLTPNHREQCFGCNYEDDVLKECAMCTKAFCRKCNFWCQKRSGGCGLVLCNDCNSSIHKTPRGWLCIECTHHSDVKRQRC